MAVGQLIVEVQPGALRARAGEFGPHEDSAAPVRGSVMEAFDMA